MHRRMLTGDWTVYYEEHDELRGSATHSLSVAQAIAQQRVKAQYHEGELGDLDALGDFVAANWAWVVQDFPAR